MRLSENRLNSGKNSAGLKDLRVYGCWNPNRMNAGPARNQIMVGTFVHLVLVDIFVVDADVTKE